MSGFPAPPATPAPQGPPGLSYAAVVSPKTLGRQKSNRQTIIQGLVALSLGVPPGTACTVARMFDKCRTDTNQPKFSIGAILAIAANFPHEELRPSAVEHLSPDRISHIVCQKAFQGADGSLLIRQILANPLHQVVIVQRPRGADEHAACFTFFVKIQAPLYKLADCRGLQNKPTFIPLAPQASIVHPLKFKLTYKSAHVDPQTFMKIDNADFFKAMGAFPTEQFIITTIEETAKSSGMLGQNERSIGAVTRVRTGQELAQLGNDVKATLKPKTDGFKFTVVPKALLTFTGVSSVGQHIYNLFLRPDDRQSPTMLVKVAAEMMNTPWVKFAQVVLNDCIRLVVAPEIDSVEKFAEHMKQKAARAQKETTVKRALRSWEEVASPFYGTSKKSESRARYEAYSHNMQWMQQQAISAATTELMPLGLMDADRRQSTKLYEAFNKLLESSGKQPGKIHCGPKGELFCLLVPRAQAEELMEGKAAIMAETDSDEIVYIYDPRYAHRGIVVHCSLSALVRQPRAPASCASLVRQPRAPASCASLVRQPRAPASCASLVRQPRAPASCASLVRQPRAPASCASLVRQPRAPASCASLVRQPRAPASCATLSNGMPSRVCVDERRRHLDKITTIENNRRTL